MTITGYNYDSYGNTTATGAASQNSLQYAGRENDGTGLSHNRARYYSPQFGRFISSDPIGLSGGLNTYDYTSGDPINFVDPMGLWQATIAFGAGWGGVLTFGKNSGQWNVGGFIGAGEGLAIDIDFTERECQASGTRGLSVFAVGAVGAGYGIDVEGEQHVLDTDYSRVQFGYHWSSQDFVDTLNLQAELEGADVQAEKEWAKDYCAYKSLHDSDQVR